MDLSGPCARVCAARASLRAPPRKVVPHHRQHRFPSPSASTCRPMSEKNSTSTKDVDLEMQADNVRQDVKVEVDGGGISWSSLFYFAEGRDRVCVIVGSLLYLSVGAINSSMQVHAPLVTELLPLHQVCVVADCMADHHRRGSQGTTRGRQARDLRPQALHLPRYAGHGACRPHGDGGDADPPCAHAPDVPLEA